MATNFHQIKRAHLYRNEKEYPTAKQQTLLFFLTLLSLTVVLGMLVTGKH